LPSTIPYSRMKADHQLNELKKYHSVSVTRSIRDKGGNLYTLFMHEDILSNLRWDHARRS
jgi:hypothetical protein